MARTKTSKAWMREHVNDPFVQKARAEGYRSRAAYKLKQIDARDRLFKPGMTVVDLGAAPGGWSQVAAKAVGPRGRVIAIDLLAMPTIPGVEFIQGDFEKAEILTQLESKLGGEHLVDLVLSDMAPNMSGIGLSDQARVVALAELALDCALKLLKKDGGLVVKLFHGTGFDDYVRTVKRMFVKVSVRKPEASRDRSAETYLFARGLKSPSKGNEMGLE